MKVTIYFVFVLLGTCYGQDKKNYKSDKSGAYVLTEDDGQYVHDDSGKYIPDYSGLYHPDNSGKYFDDGSGKYKEQQERYRQVTSGNLFPSATNLNKQFLRPSVPLVNSFDSNAGKVLGKFDDSRKKIIRQTGDVESNGYHWDFLTENEISAEESGRIHNEGTAEEGLKAKGFFKYTSPDNVVYSVAYTADENGFVPEGEHLPEALRRSLAAQLGKKA